MSIRILWLVRLEWLKFRHFAAFRVLTLVYSLLLVMGILLAKALPELPSNSFLQDLFAFPSIWKWLGYAGNWLSFFCLGFLGILSVTTEVQNRTARQNIITGMSRDEFLLGKVLSLGLVAAGATLLYTLTALTYGLIHSTLLSPALVFGTAGAWIVGRFFLMCLGYLSLGLFVGLLLRKTGLSVFIFMAYGLFGELFIRWVIHMKIFGGRSMIFYPVNALGYLMPPPVGMEEVSAMTRESGIDFLMTTGEASLTTVLYILLMLAASRILMQRRDL